MKTIKLHLTIVLLLMAVQGFSHQLISAKEDKQSFYTDETDTNIVASDSELLWCEEIINKSSLSFISTIEVYDHYKSHNLNKSESSKDEVLTKSEIPIIEDTNICTSVGSLCSISVLYPDPSSTYVWQIKTPSADWTTITNFNAGTVYSTYQSATLNIQKSSTLPVSGTLYRVITNDGISGDLTSNEAVLTVNPLAVPKLITGASPVCAGGSKVLTYGIGSIGTIQWQYSTTSSTEDFYDIDGEMGLSYTASDFSDTTWFRVSNTSGACDPVYSPAVQVVVNQIPIAGFIDGGDVTVCKSINSTDLTLYDYEGNFKWQKASDVAGSPGTFSTILSATYETYTANALTAISYYRALISSGVCPTVTTDIVAIYVDPTSVSKLITGAHPVCAGEENITLTYGTGSVGTIQWQSSTTSSTEDFDDIDGEMNLNYTAADLQDTTWFRVMNTSGECDSTYSPAVQVTVSSEPYAGYIDGGEVTVCAKSNSTVLTLSGYEGNIQWQKALDVEGSPGTFTTIIGAISEIYTAKSLTQTTYFRALVSSGICPSVTTDFVGIYVDPAPVSKLITGAYPVCAGEDITLTYGTGSVGTIQWQSSITPNPDDFSDIDGDLNYTATDLQETTWFRVMNSSDSGECQPVYSPAVKVTVSPEPNAGYIVGGRVNVCAQSNSTVLTLNNYTGNIKWQKALDVGGSPGPFTTITGAISEIYTANSLTQTTYFRALVSSGTCLSVTTESVAIYIDPTPVSKLITGASSVCAGGSKVLAYGAGSIGTIQWQLSTTSSSANFIDIDHENGLNYTASNLQETTWYRVKNTSGVCGAIYSPAVQITVSPQPNAGYIVGGDVHFCAISNSTVLTLSNYVGNIQWQKALDVGGSPGTFTTIPSATSEIYTANSLTQTTYFRALVSSGTCLSVTTESVAIYVDPTPVSKLITGASPLCIGGSKVLTYGAGSIGTIQWQSSTTSSSDNFIDIDHENGLNYTASDLQKTTWYRVKNTSGVCLVVYSPAIQITVSPAPNTGYIVGGNLHVCAQSNSTVLTLNNYAGNIQWQKALDAGGSPGTFTTIPSAISEIYTANSLTQTTYFNALVSSGACPSVATEIVAIYVDATPVSKLITGASPVCIGGSKVLVYGAGSIGTIQWQYSTTSSSDDFIDIDHENGLNHVASDLQETTWYKVKNTGGVCGVVYSPAVELSINAQPVSGFIDGGDVTVSENSNKTVLTLNDYTGTITWQKATALTGPYDDIPSANSSSYTATELTATTYFRAVVSGECSTTTSKPTIINVDSEFNVITFPNPFDSEFNIKVITLSSEPIELKVYDMLGRAIEQRQIQQTDIVEIGSNYPSGFYNIIIKQGEKEKTLRAIKR